MRKLCCSFVRRKQLGLLFFALASDVSFVTPFLPRQQPTRRLRQQVQREKVCHRVPKRTQALRDSTRQQQQKRLLQPYPLGVKTSSIFFRHRILTLLHFSVPSPAAEQESDNDEHQIVPSSQQQQGVEKPTFSSSSSSSSSRLDDILSDCTNAFPLWVLAAAIVGALRPSWLQWVNYGSLIPFLLATVMLGTGMTLQLSDFTSILQDKSSRTIVPIGVVLQYTIMPLAAYAVASWFFPITSTLTTVATTAATTTTGFTTSNTSNSALFLGLLLVGCAPGGTASNLVSLIAKANVALSVLLTACSTVLATFVTPGWVQFLFARAMNHRGTADTAGATAAAAATTAGRIHISASALMGATARVVLLPVLIGMWWNMTFPNKSRAISRFTPFLSVLLVSLICGGVVASNRTTLLLSSTASTLSLALILRIWAAVVTLHSLGFGLGYFIPKILGRYSEQTCRTLSIEVGMQNSALAVVLAKSCLAGRGGDVVALAALPGALSATTHSCLGSLLAAYWRVSTNNKSPVPEKDVK